MESISDPSQMELPSAMDFIVHPSLSHLRWSPSQMELSSAMEFIADGASICDGLRRKSSIRRNRSTDLLPF
ncbi:hypothetical protein ACOSQ3_023562 [Xanthoceras sorbifolium]